MRRIVVCDAGLFSHKAKWKEDNLLEVVIEADGAIRPVSRLAFDCARRHTPPILSG